MKLIINIGAKRKAMGLPLPFIVCQALHAFSIYDCMLLMPIIFSIDRESRARVLAAQGYPVQSDAYSRLS